MPDEIANHDLVLQYTLVVTTADCDMNARLRAGGLVNSNRKTPARCRRSQLHFIARNASVRHSKPVLFVMRPSTPMSSSLFAAAGSLIV